MQQRSVVNIVTSAVNSCSKRTVVRIVARELFKVALNTLTQTGPQGANGKENGMIYTVLELAVERDTGKGWVAFGQLLHTGETTLGVHGPWSINFFA